MRAKNGGIRPQKAAEFEEPKCEARLPRLAGGKHCPISTYLREVIGSAAESARIEIETTSDVETILQLRASPAHTQFYVHVGGRQPATKPGIGVESNMGAFPSRESTLCGETWNERNKLFRLSDLLTC